MSGRTRTTGGILQVPVMMDIQSLMHQDFTGLTKEQAEKAIEQLKTIMKKVKSRNKISMGSDIAYIPEKKIACIDLTSFYETGERSRTEASINDFVSMFTDAYTADNYGSLEASEESDILERDEYEINHCLDCAKRNAKKLEDMIEAVERAKAQGATKFAGIDFNDYDGVGGEDFDD